MSERPSTAAVKAIFPESSVRFEVTADTPIEQLCTLVGSLGKGHGDLLFVEITLPALGALRGTDEELR